MMEVMKMSEEHIKKFHPELAEYYQEGDCCTWIVELRKQVSEKDKEIERLNNIIYREISNYILKKYGMLDDTHYHDFLNELELKESANNE